MIEGQVAKIIDDRQIVINRGEGHGVKLDMVFDVLDSDAEDVIDPETGESLGSIASKKISVKVIEVKEKLSIAATFRFSDKPGGIFHSSTYLSGPALSVADMLAPPRREYERIRSSGDPVSESPVRVEVGDSVRERRKLPK